MATPIVPLDDTAPFEDATPKRDPFLPRAVKVEVVERWTDVLANLVNHSGAAITYSLRFAVLLPMAVALILAEILYRLDALIEGQSHSIATFFVGGGR